MTGSNLIKGLIAGFVATAVLSALMVMKSMMGLMPELDVVTMLTRMMGAPTPLAGWAAHFMIGTLVWGGLFALLNPINHARNAAEVGRYKVEPYVVAADVYSVAPHTGRGGWTWYTGAAGWMYQAGIESIIGIRREGAILVVEPCIPETWPGFEVKVRVNATVYVMCVKINPDRARGTAQAVLDSVEMRCAGRGVRVPLDGATHNLQITI